MSGLTSGIGSIMQAKKKETSSKSVPPGTLRERQFELGTMALLDEARGVVENATQQGQEINPMVYEMLGLKPIMEDYGPQAADAQGRLDAAQSAYDQTMQGIEQLNAIPGGKRTPKQKKMLRQLRKQKKANIHALESAKDEHGRYATMPKRITGFEKMNPEDIPQDSPFSEANPLNQIQRTTAERANQYLAGAGVEGTSGEALEIDPTLRHKYDQAEATLKENLAARLGPDWEASSVGQMAMANFNREKNEAFTQWNQQMAERYSNLAFSGQANLQSLLANRVGLMYAPSQFAAGMGANLSNLAAPRQQEEAMSNQIRLGQAGQTVSTSQPAAALQAGASGLGTLLTTPVTAGGETHTAPGWAYEGAKAGYGKLANWMGGSGGNTVYAADQPW